MASSICKHSFRSYWQISKTLQLKFEILLGLNKVMEKLDIILEQTRPKKHYHEDASNIHSEVHDRFFECIETPFVAEFPQFKRF